jgi:hypothetical protein
MTTLRIEVGRCEGTTVEDVVAGLRLAGCMKELEIVPNGGSQFIPIDELQRALEGEAFHVELVPDPEPPPLPWWRWVRTWPRRLHMWGRRVVLRESESDQLMEALFASYVGADAVHRLATAESPMMKKLQRDAGAAEPFVLRGRGTEGWHPICWKCGARYPNGPGDYRATCPECGVAWDGSEASNPPG